MKVSEQTSSGSVPAQPALVPRIGTQRARDPRASLTQGPLALPPSTKGQRFRGYCLKTYLRLATADELFQFTHAAMPPRAAKLYRWLDARMRRMR